MRFCPACGNLLLTETLSVHDDGEPYYTRYCCATCPYKHEMKRAFTNTIRTKKKQKDDVFGGDDAWENVDRTTAKCPACPSDEAFFMMIQIRSADEPMTTFYRCCECAKKWND